MTGKTLRSLAKDYANGILDKDAYRKARDELLAGVVTGKIPVLANNFRPPLPEQNLDSTFEKTEIKPVTSLKAEETVTELVVPPPLPRRERERAVPPPEPEVTVQPASTARRFAIIGGIIIVVAGLLAIQSVWNKDGQTTGSEPPSTGTAESSQSPEHQNKSATQLIEEFLKQRNWSNESLQQFSIKWNSLDPEEQANGLSSHSSIQLTNEIYKQLLEERALFGTGNHEAIMARQQSLVDFANSIGINDPRLKVREAAPENTSE